MSSLAHRRAPSSFVRVLFITLLYPLIVAAVSASLEGFQARNEVVPSKRDNIKTFEINFDIVAVRWSPPRDNFLNLMSLKQNEGELYSYNCSVGTPPQNIVIALRPWISDIQISNNTKIKEDGPWTEGYNINISKTFENSIFQASYAGLLMDNTSSVNLYGVVSSDIFYASDDFTFVGVGQNASLDKVAYIAWTNTSIAAGYYYDAGDPYTYNWLGLGLGSSQSVVVGSIMDDVPPYPTIPQYLVKSGATKSNAYSIWLDKYSKKSGHVLFGGVNSKRYQGSLITLPTIVQKTIDYLGLVTKNELTVGLDSLVINAPAGQLNITTAKSLPRVVFAHTPYTTLPLSVAKKLWDGLGADYAASLKGNADRLDRVEATIPCSFLTNTSTIDLKFAGAPDMTLQVPVSHITVRGGTGTQSDTCILLIHPGQEDLPAMLGTTMLRNLYTVYDLENTVISVALTDFNSTGDNLVVIPKGGVAAVASGAFGTSSTSATPSATGSPAPSSKVPEEAVSRGSSKKGLSIGLGVGIPVAALLTGIVAFFLIKRRKAKRNDYGTLQKGDGSVEGSHPGELGGEDKKPGYELMSNPVSEVGAGRGGAHGADVAELAQPGTAAHEVPNNQRYELG